MKKFIVSIDQGTTSSRVVLFDTKGNIKFISQYEFKQYFPRNGWVEHNPNEIWSTTIKALKQVIKKAKSLKGHILTIGITNQRETTIMWNKKTGKPIYNAIVWQDRRTQEYCKSLKNKNYENTFRKKTGLFIDPYFSATKIKWILPLGTGLNWLGNLENSVETIEKVIARESNDNNVKKIIVGGFSQGGAVAPFVAKLFNNKYDKIQGVISLSAWVLDEFQEKKDATKLNIPLFIAHGTMDEQVPYQQSEEFIKFWNVLHNILISSNLFFRKVSFSSLTLTLSKNSKISFFAPAKIVNDCS